MIVITGAAGFIGSCLVSRLNEDGFNDLILVDDFSNPTKNKNLEGKKFTAQIDRENFFTWLAAKEHLVQFVFHLGARTDTTEFNVELLNHLNLDYTKKVWQACIEYGLPLVYASSAATYGGGEFGYDDSHSLPEKLQPLNPYGISKNEFDKWALAQTATPYYWVGLKFFNVYGPNEFHKGRMASVIFHTFNQVKENRKMNLFRSHNPAFRDGGQMRDFVYVKDVCEVLMFLLHHRKKENNGIYNLGTGRAQTFLQLAQTVFKAMGIPEDISYVDTPADIRDKYQYYTQAEMQKLRSIGYDKPFQSLETGAEDYVKNYLIPNKYY
ncbi:MAG: ADP-glyceromanno-heptose 6-epimerase [Bacteroidetes bacterium]|nr:ADP-glyceromanno-heptose 6-epimerase [Bacteroidota bacterium]